jgi:pyridoxal phosphate enzyme (YggS family)
MSNAIAVALQRVTDRIHQAEAQAQRPLGAVQLIAVSKTFPAQAVREAWQHGQRAFGENYVQEFTDKVELLKDLAIEWHFIGPIQSNKTRVVAQHAHWVHSVDRCKIAERLSAQRPDDAQPLNICLQVNVSGEESKSGCQPDDVLLLAQQIAALPRLCLRGLMCIPEPTEDMERLAAQFSLLVTLQQRLNTEGFSLDTLSMGMSSDLELAVNQGATMVRVGTAIFGSRHYL